MSSSLFLVSLTEGEIPSGNVVDVLSISWAAAGVAALSIEALVLAPRTYYRMDASVPARAPGSFGWPLSELRAAGLAGRPLGIRASVPSATAATPVDFVLLKIRREPGAPDRTEPYYATLVAGDDVYRVTSTVYDSCAGAQPILKNAPLLPERRYTGGTPIRLELPRSACGRGRYAVTVLAVGRSEPLHCRFEFEHD